MCKKIVTNKIEKGCELWNTIEKTLLKIKKKPRIYSLETSKYYNPPRRGGCVCVCMSGGGG